MTIDATLNKRLARVVRKQRKMARNGVVHKVGKDGLIGTRPRLIRPRFPLRGLIVVALLFVAFKAMLYAQMGPGNYALKVESLRSGSAIEQVGAVLLQEERVTTTLGGYLTQYFFDA